MQDLIDKNNAEIESIKRALNIGFLSRQEIKSLEERMNELISKNMHLESLNKGLKYAMPTC